MTNPVYARGRRCPCRRCQFRGLLGPAVLITLGVLFLLQEYYIVPFDQSWPVLLLVIGVMIFLTRTSSSEGHIPGAWGPYTVPATTTQPGTWTQPAGSVPSSQQASPSGAQQPPEQSNDREVKP